MSQTIIVSNRLPVSIKKGENGLEVFPSAGGLATALSSYARRRGNLWIGWPGIVSDDLTEAEKTEIVRKLAAYNCSPVFLSQSQLDDFYNGYSNSVLWPFLHAMPADFSRQDKWWKTYREVNGLFADAVIAARNDNADIWVHDYQLLLLPNLLREHMPHNNIGFFLHIPFPPAAHFAKLQHGSSLLRGMMGADLIGFHTTGYADNFVASAIEHTSATELEDGLSYHQRAIRVADFPIGIDYVKFKYAARTASVQREIQKLKLRYRGKKIILTVDRLDPTKGFIERLQAYRTFLKETPELHGKVKMVMLAVPSRGDIKAYKKLRSDVEKLVSRITDEFGTKSWKPIDYLHTSVSFERLSALYHIADVCFVAPIRDGMNLVAKEYVASQGRSQGMLILSETAGAAQELKDALMVRHDQPRTLVTALKKAVKMPPKELRSRVSSMQDIIADNTVYDWAGGFMSTLKKPPLSQRSYAMTKQHLKTLQQNYESSQKRLLLLDYDGVLVPITDHPKDSGPPSKLIKTLSRIAVNPRNKVVVISGRSQNDLDIWLGDLPVTLVAEHGAAIRHPDGDWKVQAENADEWKDAVQPILEKHAFLAPGAFVEEKISSLVWHYRMAKPYAAAKQIPIIKTALRPLLKQFDLKLFMGSKILEVKSPNITKGNATKSLLEKPYDFILALGDDFTDEDTFKALPRTAHTIKVGSGKTAARYRLPNQKKVTELLDLL